MPSKKLTARGLGKLRKPETGQAVYWDEGRPGFGLRITAAGGRSWTVMYRNKANTKRRMTKPYQGTDLKAARDWADAIFRRVAKGDDPAAEEQAEKKAETFAELADLYLKDHAKKAKRSWKKDERAIERDLKPKLGKRKVHDIRRADIRAILSAIKNRDAPIQANRTLEIVRKIFAWGIQEVAAMENLPNPCLGIPKPSKEQPRHHVLTDDGIRAAWKATEQAPAWAAAVFKLRLVTAQRGVEVLHMDRAHLSSELTGAWWTIPAEVSKSGRPHRVPLSPGAVNVILGYTGAETFEKAAEHDAAPSWLFVNPDTEKPYVNVAKPLAVIRKKGKVELVNHDLRRTASSRMTELGTSRFIVERVLGHADRTVAGRHYDLYEYAAEKREALERWAAHLTKILAKKPERGEVVALAGQ